MEEERESIEEGISQGILSEEEKERHVCEMIRRFLYKIKITI